MEMVRARGSRNGVAQVPNLSGNNLLHKFFITSNHFFHRDPECGENREEAKKKEEEEEEGKKKEEDKDIELTLGLSLNGQFGTDPRSRKRKNFELGRSSSIPEGGDIWGTDMLQLDRTRSLPVGTETETKRERSEKTRAFTGFRVPPLKKKKNEQVCGMEKARNILEDMPCVSTRDVRADGKRVEGFLYWYGGNKEEVKIVCVCHGTFLSPAEFVMHGGATVSAVTDDGAADVTKNPLRHIVVKLPSSSL